MTNKGSSVIPFKKNKKTMKVAVWDTYVTKADGTIMNFDIHGPTKKLFYFISNIVDGKKTKENGSYIQNWWKV